MTPIFKEILNDIIFNDQEPKFRTIARHISEAMFNQTLTLGTHVPSYRKMAKYMNLSPNTLAAACKELKDNYRLIETDGPYGTRIVSRLPEVKAPERDLYALPDIGIHRIFFDKMTIVESRSASSNLSTSFKKFKKIFDGLSVMELEKRNSELLIPELKKLVNHKIQLYYTNDEIYYLQDYRLFIFTICKALIPRNSIFVMTKPTSTNVEQLVLAAGKKVGTVLSANPAVFIDDLEKICEEKKVGIVCISANILPSFETSSDTTVITRLKQLEQDHKFKILIDDRHPGLIDMTRLVNEHLFELKHALIYIRPVTIIHKELNTVNVIAAPKKVTSILRKRLHGKNLIDPLLGSVLAQLLHKGALTKEEVIIFNKVKLLQNEVRAQLKSLSTWDQSYINYNRGYFIYLKPIGRMLAPDLFRQLAELHIFILDPSTYDLGPSYQGGILISFAANLNSYFLHKDIEKLHKTIIKLSNVKD